MSLLDVKHQGAAQRAIQLAVAGQRVPHAYIFHGPDGVGRETLAVGLAGLLLCANRFERRLTSAVAEPIGIDRLLDACGSCDDCRLVAARIHPDLHVIYRQLVREHPESDVRARKGLEIGVDVMRHFVIARMGLTPNRGRAKVFIIREADVITTQAQNALLKTLEEPPGAAYIILLAGATDRLLPTTLSRCQIVRFGTLPTRFVSERFAAAAPDVPSQEAQWYAKLAGGSIGQAVRFARDGLYALNGQVIAALQCVRPAGTTGRSASMRRQAGTGGTRSEVASRGRPSLSPPSNSTTLWIEQAKALGEGYKKEDPDITDTEATRRALKTILLLAATFYADLLRVVSGQPSLMINDPWRDELIRAAQGASAPALIDNIQRIALAEGQLDQNAHTQLCVEVLTADLAAA